MKMSSFLRFIIYTIVVLLIMVLIFIKKEIKLKQEQTKIVSIISEWQEKGYGVDIEQAIKQKFQLYIKAMAKFISPNTLECYITPEKAQYIAISNVFESLDKEYKIKGVVVNLYEVADIGLYVVKLVIKEKLTNIKYVKDLLPIQILSKTYYNRISVPNTAMVNNDENKFFIWIFNNDKALLREVLIGPSNGVRTVIKSGIMENEYVIINGLSKLKEGIKVRVHSCMNCNNS